MGPDPAPERRSTRPRRCDGTSSLTRRRPAVATTARRETTGVTDDGALVVAALGGDHDAFASLFRRHGPGVHGFAQRRTRSVDLADEVTSLTFEQAWRSLDRLGERHGHRFRPWVFRIAANEMASLMRSLDRRGRRERTATTIGHVPAGDSPTADAFDAIDTAIDHEGVLDAMTELNDRHQAVLSLRFLSDLDTTEAAHALGVSKSNVAVLTHRALNALRAQLDTNPREVASDTQLKGMP